ncbi:MAG: pyruvate ferredoxin oxidoreductase [Candidatus Diapherotrites archaeon]|jgi:pyruvate ferredoxin oxidoreductase alpha subunit|uniref:Pyruvate ferredoxin oxidoreductase n=1 Tax=Candidatus Iainarchaeum sp. TaxID=3101447 RepID=A0A7K4BZS1_9ARCH|nr:pyruvate ferredoxin oxidoreductase [Candidatus Diapherotrites archaeon]
MSEKKVISGSDAVAQAVKLCKPKVLPMYPITPSTLIPEKLSEFIANGEMDAQLIHVESEHSAISALYGAYAAGVRTFTATASQGLALMHEIIPIVAGSRMPAVMVVANRALSGPLNIWNDHSDAMSERDQGWIQLYCEDVQEAFDTTIMAYKIAEKNNVLLPVMVCIDGFSLTHVYEPVIIEDQNKVDLFLPEYKPRHYLDPKNPKTFGAFAQPNTYFEFKEAEQEAMKEALKEIQNVHKEFATTFGREYGGGLIELINMQDAEYALVTVGGTTGTARMVLEELRKEGKKAGIIRIKSVRPFPKEEIIKATKKIKNLGVIDRHISIGSEGPLFTEIKATLKEENTKVAGFIAGLGGRDISREMIKKAFEIIEKGEEGVWLK